MKKSKRQFNSDPQIRCSVSDGPYPETIIMNFQHLAHCLCHGCLQSELTAKKQAAKSKQQASRAAKQAAKSKKQAAQAGRQSRKTGGSK